MTSVLAKVALAAALTVASIVGLVGLSGMIIFADLKTPEPASVVDNGSSGGAGQSLTITGPNS
jgi:DNA/RNA endonuclease YhcR with UshA esterase domain